MQPSGPIVVVRRVLGNPALRRVLLSYLAFHVAEYGTWVAILLYAYETTGPASVGLVALVQLVPAALVSAPAASLGDRLPRERVLTGGYLVQAMAMLVTGAAMLSDAPVPVVLLAATVAATSLVITRPTQSALLPSLARTPDELTAANGAAGVVEGLGVLVGPLLAAAIVAVATTAEVFLVAGASLMLAALATLRLRPRIGQSIAVAGGRDRSVLAGLRTIAADRDARLVVGLLTGRMVVIGSIDVLLVLAAIELLGMGEPGAGLLNAALGAGTIVGGALAFGLIGRGGLATTAAIGAVVWGVAFVALGLLAAPLLAVLLIVIGGAGLTVVDVAGRTILQRSIQDAVLARVFGLQEALAMAGLAAGAVLAAALAVAVGLLPTIIIVGALLPVMVAFIWGRLAALDRRALVPMQALDLLRRSTLFAPLPGPQLEGVARRGVWLTVAAGTAIIRQGDVGDRYYVLADGAVRVDQDGEHRRDLDTAGQGIGEIALLRDVPRTATVTTTRESVFLAIDRAPFLAAVTGHPAAFAAAGRIVADLEGPR